MSEFKWFVVIFLFLWLVWFATGGPKDVENRTNPFIREPKTVGDPKRIYNRQPETPFRP